MKYRLTIGPCMTLATVILLINLPWTILPGRFYWSARQGTPAFQDQTTASPQAPAADAKQSTPPTTPAQSPVAQTKPTKKAAPKKKSTSAGCDAPASAGSKTSAGSPSNPPAGAETGSPQASGSPEPPQSCPPSKTIVRQGGASEPNIQLAGGSGSGNASQARDTTAQMLGTTENNLKKLKGQQLSASQQSSVTQIRQFIDQSKKALASGDAERARTLAWKAQLLSEDLVKPPQ